MPSAEGSPSQVPMSVHNLSLGAPRFAAGQGQHCSTIAATPNFLVDLTAELSSHDSRRKKSGKDFLAPQAKIEKQNLLLVLRRRPPLRRRNAPRGRSSTTSFADLG